MTPFQHEAARCRIAQSHWQSLPVRTRTRFLSRVRQFLVDRAERLGLAVAQDVRRDPLEVVGTDLLTAAANAKWLERHAERILLPRRARGSPIWLWDCKDIIYRRPHGIVGVIGTWNYPIFLTLGAILPALVAGNGVLWKPSELTPRTADEIERLLADTDLPRDLVIRLPGTREAGPELCESAIDFLHFTGSDAVGRRIAARLGERLIPSALELSGCDAFIVLENADIDLAARTAFYGATLNHGQTCMSTRRVFIPRSSLDAITQKLQPLVQNAKARPLVMPQQADQYRRLVKDAIVHGVRTIRSDSDGITPVLVIDPPANLPICVESSFAPILSVVPFDSLDDLTAKYAASPYGLSGAVFGTDRQEALAVAARIQAGSVVINDVIVPAANPATPFGGRGASGWNVTQGEEGLLAMTVPQAVSIRRGRFRPHVDAALTGDPAASDIMMGLLKLSHAARWRDRLSGLRQLIRGARSRKTSNENKFQY